MALWAVKKLAIHADVVNVGIGLGTEFGDDLAVYGDVSPVVMILLGLAARSNSGSGDNFFADVQQA